MNIAILNPKGGSGKTTLALNLARGLTLLEDKVLLVDCDPQGSSLAWAMLAQETPFVVGRSITSGFEHTLLDMPPVWPSALPKADLILVPTTLDGVSFAVFLRFVQRLQEEGRSFLPVVNRFNPYRAEHKARLKEPELANAVVVRERACFASCYAQGTTVYDMTTPHVSQGQADIECVIEALGIQKQEDAEEGAKE